MVRSQPVYHCTATVVSRPNWPIRAKPKNLLNGLCCDADFCGYSHSAQLFQPTATGGTSWRASSLLIEYTEDENPQQDLEESLQIKSCDLDTKGMFYLHAIKYCKTIIRHILGYQK